MALLTDITADPQPGNRFHLLEHNFKCKNVNIFSILNINTLFGFYQKLLEFTLILNAI